jgi:hypothetical protein
MDYFTICSFDKLVCQLAAGATPNKALYESLQGKLLELFEVGDCVEPRRIRGAIEEAMWAAVVI